MKSSGGDYERPNTPAPPAEMILGQGRTATGQSGAPVPNFLPSDLGAMATGLTEDMFAPVTATAAPSVTTADPLSAVAAGEEAPMTKRDLLAMLLNAPFGKRGVGTSASSASSGGLGGF